MTETTFQLDLFHQRTLNTTYEVKREMRLGVSRSHLSREQIVDRSSGCTFSRRAQRVVEPILSSDPVESDGLGLPVDPRLADVGPNDVALACDLGVHLDHPASVDVELPLQSFEFGA